MLTSVARQVVRFVPRIPQLTPKKFATSITALKPQALPLSKPNPWIPRNAHTITSFKKSKPIFRQYCTNAFIPNAPDPVVLPPSVLEVPRGVDRKKLAHEVGDEIHGYVVTGKKYFDVQRIMVYELIHTRTGAKHAHMECDDTENAFFMTLKTIPSSDNGVAHILEHMVLCGSEKYPVRDPFFNMTRRSLASYMNAWTSADHTSYPFSTTNVKDYYNLMSVYLDAIYFPHLDHFDFLQEGHRLAINEETGSLEHTGVVYNEMKGVVSDPGEVFYAGLVKELYPKTTYHYYSGGSPPAIRNIQHNDVLEFHKEFYHPSNSYTVTYGDMPLSSHLEFIDKHAFSKFPGKIQPRSHIPPEERLKEPKEVRTFGPLSPLSEPDSQAKVAVAWLLDDMDDRQDRREMSFLVHHLISGQNSPFYKSLIDSKLGLSYSPIVGFNSSYRTPYFVIGVSDANNENIDKIPQVIMETLKQAAEEGIPKDRMEAALHQYELSEKSINPGAALNFASHVGGLMIHGYSPTQEVTVNEFLKTLRERVAAGPHFENMIKEKLINNPHRVTFIMTPEKTYLEDTLEEEAQSLQKLESTQFQPDNKKAREDLLITSQSLKERQEAIVDPSILPKIKVSDLSRKAPETPFETKPIKSAYGEIDAQWVDAPTNGLVYIRSRTDISDIPKDLMPFLPLWASFVTRVGAGKRNSKELEQFLDLHTGGISGDLVLNSNVDDTTKYRLYLSFSSSCLSQNTSKMFEALKDVMTCPTFEDHEQLKTLIGISVSSSEEEFVNNSLGFAKSLAAAKLDPMHALSDGIQGIERHRLLKSFHGSPDKIPELSQKLAQISKYVLDSTKIRFAINAESSNWKTIENELVTLSAVFSQHRPPILGNPDDKSFISSSEIQKPDFLGLPIQVNHVAKVYSTGVNYNHPDFSSLDVLSNVVSTILHREIREKGGAYGSGMSTSDGIISFSSYRDPNLQETLEAFDFGINWVINGEFTDEQLDSAKLECISALDTPIPPMKRGLRYFRYGITQEMAQARRQRIFDTDRQTIIGVAKKYLRNDSIRTAIAVAGSEESGFDQNPDWKYISI